MRFWARSLGVSCDHCHPGDSASEAKPEKNAARAMLRMTRRINVETARVAKSGGSVTCCTCHRGHVIPESALPPQPKS